jgi:hypothetical protein
VYEALLSGGTLALFELATAHGFEPDEKGYASRCVLCFFMRKFLSGQKSFPELHPEYYKEALQWN